jgi:transcriptional regulator with GAF, ATPase, and Fis domain
VHLSSLHQEPEEEPIPQSTERVLTQDELEQLEIKNLQLALKKARGKVFGENGAAQLIGIPPTTLSSKIKKYGLSPHQYDH